MSTKIQINSLEALERLIGGDTELEIELRNTVVQEFSKKHLKCIARDKMLEYGPKVKEYVQAEIAKVVKQWKTYNKDYALAPSTCLEIQRYVDQLVKNELLNQEFIQSQLGDLESKLFNIINKRVEELVTLKVKTMVQEAFTKAMHAAGIK
jgi:hypothetical protein